MDTEATERPFAAYIDSQGIARVHWEAQTRIHGELATRSIVAVDALRGRTRGPVLVSMRGVDVPTWEARQVFAQPGSATRIALVGTSPTDQMIARFNLGTDPLTVPRQFFYDEDDAVRWLLAPTDAT